VSSYDPLPQLWRRRSRDDSKRSWRASRRQPRKRQPRRRQPRRRRPQRRLTGRRQRPRRPLLRWLPRRQQWPRPPRPRYQRHQQHRQVRRLRRSRRRFRAQACHGLRAKPRLPLGSAKRPAPPHHGRVPGPPEDSPALQLHGVPVRRGPATTRSPPRREWVGRVRRVPARTPLDLGSRVHLPAVLRWPLAVAQEFRECHDPTRR
jgi:hypothetical protein